MMIQLLDPLAEFEEGGYNLTNAGRWSYLCERIRYEDPDEGEAQT